MTPGRGPAAADSATAGGRDGRTDAPPRRELGAGWAQGFVRGLTIGALVGAAIAGTAVIRRFLDDLGPPRGTDGS